MSRSYTDEKTHLKLYTTKTTIAACFFALLGFLGLWLSEGKDVYNFIKQLSSIAVITGVWTIIYDMFLRSSFLKLIEENMHIINDRFNSFDNIEKSGLELIEIDSNRFSYELFLKNNKK